MSLEQISRELKVPKKKKAKKKSKKKRERLIIKLGKFMLDSENPSEKTIILTVLVLLFLTFLIVWLS